ncbi:MAG: tetratricopeptide repeat protein [Gemmatimonadota bacterium]
MSQGSRHRRDETLPSVLPPGLRGLLSVALALAAFMLGNTLYLLLNRLAEAIGWSLFAVGETSLPKLFQAMVLTHTGVGLLLALLMLGFFLTHLPVVWKRRHAASVATGAVFVGAGLTLAVTGLFILTAAASQANRWAWWAHVLAAALVPVGYVLHRLVSYARPPRARWRRFAVAIGAVTAVLLVWHALAPRGVQRTARADRLLASGAPGGGAGAANREARRYAGTGLEGTAFLPVGYVPPRSPFFPSPSTTTTGGWVEEEVLLGEGAGLSEEELAAEAEELGFVVGRRIGAETCARCHAATVAQWEASAHRFASFNNPFYEATVEEMRKTAGVSNPWVERHRVEYGAEPLEVGHVKSQWCAGCHDPALLFTGRMGREVARASPGAQAGLTCLACHRIDRTHDLTGDGNYNVADEQGDPYLFAGAAPGSLGAFLHDAAVKARPAVHKRRMLKGLHRTPEFCAACHKVSLTAPVNNYRWLRGQDEYDNWHDSGIARNASRTFYLPAERRVCQDCHMPAEAAVEGDVSAKEGKVRSHRFLAVNTALPFVRGDTATLRRIEEFLRDEKLRVELFAVRRGGGPGSRDDRLAMDLRREPPSLAPGERVVVDVVVRNLGVGHTFPGGTNDSNEGWIELTLTDGEGRVLARSGGLGPDGHLDPLAHVYKSVLLDAAGAPIDRRNAPDIHVTAASNVIGPGTADVAHYAFTVPPLPPGSALTIRARLLWRKFFQPFTEFAFRANPAGFPGFEEVPELPVTEIAADEVTLSVTPDGSPTLADGDDGSGTTSGSDPRASAPSAGPPEPPEWVRYNDYGIGLLLQGNTRLARRAFQQVARRAPEQVDGPLNLARSAAREGDLEAAYAHLERCEEIEPGNARVAWVWGTVLQEDGRYEDAAAAYRRVLEAFPADRAAWRNLGRTLYLDRRYPEALEAFGEVLGIDPEDRVAHYHRMLIYRALGREREAREEEAAYEYYRIDESAQEVTREFRLRHAGVNLMAQRIHTHELHPEPPFRRSPR